MGIFPYQVRIIVIVVTVSSLFLQAVAPLSMNIHENRNQSKIFKPSELFEYKPPAFTPSNCNVPKKKLKLGVFPTPVQDISTAYSKCEDYGCRLFIKRDDMSGGVELGGNKIRKLEFLLADALEHGYDSVVTIGGEQSNHCRATASAARLVQLEPHLILRTAKAKPIDVLDETSSQKLQESMGYTGNLMYNRLAGAHIYACSPGEYGRMGSKALVDQVCRHIIQNSNKKPYPIPVGGSNGIGTWGYLEGVNELIEQCGYCNIDDTHDENVTKIDHVVFACGSGGTAAGITLGFALAHGKLGDLSQRKNSHKCPMIHAVGVCDDPDYFYNEITTIGKEMGLFSNNDDTTKASIKEWVTVHQGKGCGYAVNTEEELTFIRDFSLETGIVLDPVYSGKAMYHFISNVLDKEFKGGNILFWHTGGNLGLYDKVSEFDDDSQFIRLDVYDKKKS